MAISTTEINALNAQLKTLTDSLRNFTNVQSSTTRDVYNYAQSVKTAESELESLENAFKDHGKVSKEETRIQKDLLKAKQIEIALTKKLKQEQSDLLAHSRRLREEYKQGKITLEEFNNQRKINHQSVAQTKADLIRTKEEVSKNTKLLQLFGNSLGGAAKGLHAFTGVLASIGSSILNFNKVFLDATLKSGGVVEEYTGNFDQGMSYWLTVLAATGVEAGKVLEIMANNRQAVNAMGGIVNAIELTEDAILDMRGFYGSIEESMRAHMGIVTQFATKGIRPTDKTLRAYNNDLIMLAEQTGLAAPAINDMVNSIANDTDSITLLRAAREDEREAILSNQRALLKSNIALGMNAEQASQAAKMLNKMVAQKPLDRLKQAAKMQAIGSALGLGSEATRAAAGVRAGSRATAQQREDINNFNIAVTGIADTAAQQGMANELFVTQLIDKLDMNEYYREGSPFSTTMGNVLAKSQTDVAEMYRDSTDSTIVAINNIADIAGEMLKSLLSGQAIWGALLQITRLANRVELNSQLAVNSASGTAAMIGAKFTGDYTKVDELIKEREKLEQALDDEAASNQARVMEQQANHRMNIKEQARVNAKKIADEKLAAEWQKRVDAKSSNEEVQPKIPPKEVSPVKEVRPKEVLPPKELSLEEIAAKIAGISKKGENATVADKSEIVSLQNKMYDAMVAEREQSTKKPDGGMMESVFSKMFEFATPGTVDNLKTTPKAPTSAPTEVQMITNPTKDAQEKTRADKAESLLSNHVTLTSQQNNKIDEQLGQMKNSNEFLKIIAETNPKLVELAEKQLAVSTMTQEQKDRAASRLRSESSKFNTDYSYSI